eukprot:TRINITY_DN2281_c0_g1_i1.p1 TRINITY_DN2281_c0_g1~~TRINITY_DN2281_c0_g1_i1.p1  ORF type:complete len:995 (+),score=188.46 TRINITY_DN2281_c0_g1_i1:197-3181(+)
MSSQFYFIMLLTAIVSFTGAESVGVAATKKVFTCTTSQRTRLTVQLQWTKQAQFAGIYTALERGYYNHACLDVIVLSGGPSVDVMFGVEKGSTHLLFNQPSVVLNMFNKSYAERQANSSCFSPVTDLVLVSQVMQRNPFRLASLATSGITSFQDLRDRVVGVWPGFEFETRPALHLQQPSMEPGTDYDESTVWFSVEPLFDGSVDALPVMEFNELGQLVSRRREGSLTDIYSLSDFTLLNPETAGGAMLSSGIYASRKWLDADPVNRPAVERFLFATLRGHIAARVDEAGSVALSFAGEDFQRYMARSLNRHVWPAPHGFGMTTQAAWDRTVTLHTSSASFVPGDNISMAYADRVDLSMMEAALAMALEDGTDVIAAEYDEPILPLCAEGDSVSVCRDDDELAAAVIAVPVTIFVMMLVVAAVGGTIVAKRMVAQRQQYLKIYGDNALAQSLARAVMLWDMEVLGELRSLRAPTRLQRRFMAIADQLVTIRPYIPASVIGILQETAKGEAEECQSDASASVAPSRVSGRMHARAAAKARSSTHLSVVSDAASSSGSKVRRPHSRTRSHGSNGSGSRATKSDTGTTHRGDGDQLAMQAKDRLSVGMSMRSAVVAVVKIFGTELLPPTGTHSFSALYAAVLEVAMRSAGLAGVVSVGPDSLLMATWNSATVCSTACDGALTFADMFAAGARPILEAFAEGTGSCLGVGGLRVGVGIARQDVRVGIVGTATRMQHVTPIVPRLAEGLARYAAAIAPAKAAVYTLVNGAAMHGAGSAHLLVLRGLVSWCQSVSSTRLGESWATQPRTSGDGLCVARVATNTSVMPVYVPMGHLHVREDEWMYQLDSVRQARAPLDAFNDVYSAVLGVNPMDPSLSVHGRTVPSAQDLAPVSQLVALAGESLRVRFEPDHFVEDLGWLRAGLQGGGGERAEPVMLILALSRAASLTNPDLACGLHGDGARERTCSPPRRRSAVQTPAFSTESPPASTTELRPVSCESFV